MSESNLTPLRCYKCNFEFVKFMTTEDSWLEIICPKCNKETVELDPKRKIKNEIIFSEYFCSL